MGRSYRKWWQSLPHKKRTVFLNHLKRNSNKYLAIGGGTTLASSTFYFTHLEEHPITHRRRFILFTRKQLEEIEHESIEEVCSKLNFNFSKFFIYFKLFKDFRRQKDFRQRITVRKTLHKCRGKFV